MHRMLLLASLEFSFFPQQQQQQQQQQQPARKLTNNMAYEQYMSALYTFNKLVGVVYTYILTLMGILGHTNIRVKVQST